MARARCQMGFHCTVSFGSLLVDVHDALLWWALLFSVL